MKKLLLMGLFIPALVVSTAEARRGGYVHGYTRANGTYVHGYYRGGSSGGYSSAPYVPPSYPSEAPDPLMNSTATGSDAKKFNQWYFTTCRDGATGRRRTGITTGHQYFCDLVIETNGAPAPQSAYFTYELEYREAGRSIKKKLSGGDKWTPESLKVHFRQEGNNLIFTLPINVRTRVGRVYSYINVTGAIQFADFKKTVYEPLPIMAR